MHISTPLLIIIVLILIGVLISIFNLNAKVNHIMTLLDNTEIQWQQ